jgi:predicted RNase H-like HicB family nuclease
MEEEALRNLEQALEALMETYDEEMKQRLAEQ